MKLNLTKKLTILALPFVLVGIFLINTQTASAEVPSGHDKNYEYPLQDNNTCAGGDFGEFGSITPNKDPNKVTGNGLFACIRIRSDLKGYDKTNLTTNDPTINACDSGAHLIKVLHPGVPPGWRCIKETDPKLWDKSLLTGIQNSDSAESCQSLAGSHGVQCITRQPDTAELGQCGSSPTCGITENIINPLIKLAAGAVGLVVLIMIIVGGIEYSTAGGDAAKVTSAKKRIFNAIFALVTFILLYSILAWLDVVR